MKKFKFLVISILPFMWLIYILFELFTGRITNSTMLIGNIALLFLFAIIGYIIYVSSLKFNNGLKRNQLIILFTILMILDQGSKLLIKLFFFNDNIVIIKDFLSFNPIINTDGSWLNARFNTGIGFPILIFVNFIALFIFTEIYRYYNCKNKQSFWVDSCFIFMFAGALCSLIDKIFYGGSLDFIGIGDLFIADLKDIFINLGVLFFIASMYISGAFDDDTDNSSLKDDIKAIGKFIAFIKTDIKKLCNRKKT